MSSKMNVLFLHGPAAAGKYTIGSLLSPMLDMPLFHNHLVVDVAKTLFDFGTPEFVALRAVLWRECFSAAAVASRSFIFTFNPEVTVAPALVQDLVAIIEQSSGQVHFVELVCDDETILTRLNEPSRATFGKLVDADLYQRLKAAGQFDYPPLPAAMIAVDTAVQAPIESAALIADAYKKELAR